MIPSSANRSERGSGLVSMKVPLTLVRGQRQGVLGLKRSAPELMFGGAQLRPMYLVARGTPGLDLTEISDFLHKVLSQ